MRGSCRLLWNLLTLIIPVGTMVGSALGQDCHVHIIFRAIDKHTQPIANITADQLRAEVNGSAANISSLTVAKPGIILVLDASSSMKGAWNQSIQAARRLVERAGESVVIFVFDEQIYSRATGRSESQNLLDQISRQTPTGHHGTALYDTLIQIAGRVTTRNAAIVVISDGEDDASVHSSAATVSQFLHSSWPPVFGLILDYDQSDSRMARGHFKKILAATGGLAIYPSSASKVPIATDELAAIVLNSFTLTLQPSLPIKDSEKLKLEVIGPQGKQNKEIDLLHVAEIAGCDSQEAIQH